MYRVTHKKWYNFPLGEHGEENANEFYAVLYFGTSNTSFWFCFFKMDKDSFLILERYFGFTRVLLWNIELK